MTSAALNSSIGACFITGATGFLGSRVVGALCEGGGNIYCLKRKSSNLSRLSQYLDRIELIDLEEIDFGSFFRRHPVKTIFHCATDYGRKSVDPLAIIESNLLLPLRILHHAAAAGVSVFINTDTVLDKKINNYSLSKHQFTEWMENYSDCIIGVNVALQHFYGPEDDATKFVTFVVNSLLSDVDRIPLTLGKQRRDFIYIDDVVSALIKIAEAAQRMDHGYHEFEVGSGVSVSIYEFVQLAKSICGNVRTELDFGAIPYRPGEVMEVVTDTTPLKTLGWAPRFSLDLGLANMIAEQKVKKV